MGTFFMLKHSHVDEYLFWIVQTNISGGQGMSFGEDGSETTQVTIPKDVSSVYIPFLLFHVLKYCLFDISNGLGSTLRNMGKGL